MEHNYPNQNPKEQNSQHIPTYSSPSHHDIHSSEKNHILPFSVIFNLPKGFCIQKQIDPKLIYDVSYLSMSKETCKKSIEVDNCGYVDVDLHVLKIKGCLSFLINVCIEPIPTRKICSTDYKNTSVFLCAQDTLYVDHILKYSVDKLPYYAIDEDHIQVRKLEINMLDQTHGIANISGEFYFEYE
ncbi:hypothetical protein [Bacillus thuringiensis]|uniref:hypothetical protein n=1 Tax=Bacillus thuringiensis TaxID=1428 RepID=UPI000A38B50D|nr:hypothetical protein [Bacillus thuringiensis]OUA82763.1 hypothetical protein BK706_31200 [Bacillus thuringiensis serovar leesis]OUA92391.1 hypothetical protein BK706_10410 [Bacillus thuringiensis serovar leesis]OUA92403.1 hypothetical protein BK706_10350 [Bacillus thuringiensis serovar leesis]